MKIKITKIHRSDKDKEGNPYKNKDGNPYTRVGIQAQEYGQEWLSGFENRDNANWKEGDEVEIEVTKVPNGKGGYYLNFRHVGKFELLERRVKLLEESVKSLMENRVPVIQDDEVAVPIGTYGEPDDLPF